MFRLEKNQINIVLILLLVTSALIFVIFGVPSIPGNKKEASFSELTDFSDGWISAYETSDAKKMEEQQALYNSQKSDNNTMTVTEILNMPETIPVNAGKTVTMTQKLPDYGMEDIYLIFHTNGEAIQVSIGGDMVYNSGRKEDDIPSTHIVRVNQEMRGKIVTVSLTGGSKAGMELSKIEAGTYANLLYSAWKENGAVGFLGVFILFCSLMLLIPWLLFVNVERQKALLFYGILEGITLGIFFVLESRLFQVVTGWNYALYLTKIFVLIMAMILHITVIHCNMFKKKILFLTSLGILFCGILFISLMVFQAFSLITVTTAYNIVAVCAMLEVLLYVIVIMIGIYKYGRREGRILLLPNGMLLLGIAMYLLGRILRHGEGQSIFCIAAGAVIYMFFIYFFGLKLTFTIPKTVNRGEKTEEEMRGLLVEQLNPNLLFASFHTLQNLIKNGSANSVKMIYYISVYIRDNLRAFEHSGEIISFEAELEHIIAYLQLQRTRNRGLNFSMECKERDFKIPRYSIEPMVENAVKHGISNHGNKGNVVVRTYQRADGYAIQVIDDGAGFDRKLLKKESPTALLNLFDRLENQCKAQVELISKEDKGTVITIILPMLENELLKENKEDEG